MFKNFNLASILSIIIIGLFVGVVFVYADWEPPKFSPTRCDSGDPGCDAPINTGSTLQNKAGSLGINGFIDVLSDAFFRSNVNVTGNIDAGGNIKGSNLCIGNDCRNNWPAGAGAESDTLQSITDRGNTTDKSIAVADGSISSPAYSFSNDTNTGMYRYGSDILGFVTGGLSRMMINGSGILRLYADGGPAGPALQIGTSNGGIFGDPNVLGFSTGAAERMRINNSGLNVSGNISATGNITSQGQNVCLQNGTNCPAGATAPKIIRGTINAGGGTINGTGFTSIYMGTGQYRIIFTTSFNNTPIVVATALGVVDIGSVVTVTRTDVSSFDLDTTFNGPRDNTPFHFIAIEP
ncbi:MAG: hypothetical protein AAB405_00915 [Patescibacteria group bacterium]